MLDLYNKLNNTKYTIDELFFQMVKKNNLKMVEVCLKYGADVHAVTDVALYWAATDGHIEIVELLLNHGDRKSVV